jgi:hypothetical protein
MSKMLPGEKLLGSQFTPLSFCFWQMGERTQ